MSQVSFIDSSGLGAVVSVLKHMGSQGKFHLVSVTPAVMAVLRLTRMDRVFKIFSTRQDALAA
jgi:anti-sigma B factor antagonist